MCERMVATLAQPGARVGSAQRQPGTGQNSRCREGAPRPLAGDRSRSRADPRSPPTGVPGAGGPGLAASPIRHARIGQPGHRGRRG